MASIFISYRRSDSEGEAGRLADDLARRFGDGAVFMDVDTIQPGRDFRKAIDESIRSCNVLLAIIGPEWFSVLDSNGDQRLADTSDYVRLEIASALERDITVVPVMIRGARMPLADTLPTDLRDLAFRNAVELTHARWRSDVQFLIDALLPQLQPGSALPPATASASGGMRVPSPASASGSFRVPATSASAEPASLDPAQLQLVARELARFIGPISTVVVRRAARSASTLADLTAEVAREIESPRDRAAFLAAAPR